MPLMAWKFEKFATESPRVPPCDVMETKLEIWIWSKTPDGDPTVNAR